MNETEHLSRSAANARRLQGAIDRFDGQGSSRMELVTVDAAATHGAEVSFAGRKIVETREGLVAYRTALDQIAIVNREARSLVVFKTVDAFEWADPWAEKYPEMVIAVKREFSGPPYLAI